MSTQINQQLFGNQSSRWLTNQAVSSAEMIERMVKQELRRGDFSEFGARVRRIEELVNEHSLDSGYERRLLLLEALFREGAGDTQGAYRIVGKLLAQQDRLDQSLLSELRRFRARLALNGGNVKEARSEVTLTDRVVMETLRGFGQVNEVINDDLTKVTGITWLLSAEVALEEREFDRALQDLANAHGCGLKSADEAATFELLSALVCVGMGDSGGAAAVAHLYELHVVLRSESSVDAITRARIAAAAGDMGQLAGISESEALRWRGYGPDPEIVKHYLQEGASSSVPSSLLEKLPLPHELIAAMDETLVDTRSVGREGLDSEREGQAFALLPMSFLFEFFRLEEVTGMFDFNLKTGHLVVDWSGCDEGSLVEAVEVGAISELVLRCKGGTIYLNNGSYVDARLDSEEADLRDMAPVDVIFELFRISTAGLPGAGARQFSGGPECARVPEVINLRPNKFNLDLTKRLDNMRSGRTDEEPDEEVDLDAAFANWGNSAGSGISLESSGSGLEGEGSERSFATLAGAEVAGEEFSFVGQWSGLPCLLGIVEAEGVVALELSIVECLASFGLDRLRVEIVLSESGERVRECGLYEEACEFWGKYSAGALSILLGFAKGLKVACPEVVDVVMRIAAQRLRVVPGKRHFDDVELSEFVAEDPATQSMLSNLRDLAMLDGSGPNRRLKHILLEGERGVGKELLARAIHGWSARSGGSFCAVNLGAVTKELATAEVFGARKGSFTGSVADRRGYIEKAEGGTLFLDELDEAPDNTQALLKRVVQFGTFNVVGSPDEQKCDVRFVAATNRMGGEEIKLDLQDRFIKVRVPALRERRRDIRPLAQQFARLNKYSLPETVCVYLESLQWPGNVRQLETVVERVCALAKSQDDITLEAFEASVRESGGNPESGELDDSGVLPLRTGETLKDRLNVVSKQVISDVLRACGGNKTHAADRLGMSRQNLSNRIKEFEIPEVGQ